MIIAARGKVQKLAEMLRAIKGIKHATLSVSSTGKDIDERVYIFVVLQ